MVAAKCCTHLNFEGVNFLRRVGFGAYFYFQDFVINPLCSISILSVLGFNFCGRHESSRKLHPLYVFLPP